MLPGPAFFVLLQTSIKNGIRQAMAFDLGVLIADIAYIFVAYLFFAEVQALQSHEGNLRIGSGVIFIIFGLMLFSGKSIKFKKRRRKLKENIEEVKEKPKREREENYVYLFLKGLFLNGFNPGVIFFWFTVIAVGSDEVDVSGNRLFWYLTLILITFFIIDLLKIFGANKLQKFITPKFLEKLNKLVGIIIMVIGIVLVGYGVHMNY